MLGPVTINGFAWQGKSQNSLPPGTYAHSRIICKKHHDELDGLDKNALAYFRNWMLIMGAHHISDGRPGKLEDITPTIIGRDLERWFMKTIIGLLSSGNVRYFKNIPDEWIKGLFLRNQWPDEWALYFIQGYHETKPQDAAIHFDFHWALDLHLLGANFISFGVQTYFSIVPSEYIQPNFLRRPSRLGAFRTDSSGALEGMPAGHPIEFQLSW